MTDYRCPHCGGWGLPALLRDATQRQAGDDLAGTALTYQEAAMRLGVSPRSIRLLVARGDLPVVTMTGARSPRIRASATRIEGCYRALRETGYAPSHIGDIHVTLKGALQDAVEEGVLLRNPARGAVLPRRDARTATVLTWPQLQTLLSGTAGDRYHALWVVLGHTGLRIGEALALTWDLIDDQEIAVEYTVVAHPTGGLRLGPPKTEASRRRVPNVLEIRQALTVHRVQVKEARLAHGSWAMPELVFPNTRGALMRTDTASDALHRALEQLGLPRITLHGLRHTFATIWLQVLGLPVETLAKQLGHSKTSTTYDAYAHVLPGQQAASVQRFAKLLRGEGA